MNKPVIEFKNVDAFRGNSKIFENLSLSINYGESLVILGANGSGKTTLLKLLSREIYPVVKPNSSLKIFGNENINIWELRKKVGFVSPEFQNQYETMSTGLDVVLSAFFGSVGLCGHHKPSKTQRQTAVTLMESLKISDLKHCVFLTLSSGQQRRLLLARALIHKPKILIFDEPTNNLDVGGSVQLLNDMRELANQGVAIILVSHHLHEVIPEIRRVIGLNNGKIQFDGEKNKVLTSVNLSELFNTPLCISQHKGYFQWTPNTI